MNESHQEITRSVDAESSEHQFVRAVSLAAFGQMSGSQQSMSPKRWSPRPTNAESWTKRRNALPERSESIHSSLADGNVRRRFGGTVNVATDEAATLLTIAR